MVERNWIEEIKEFIRKAMNEGLTIYAYKSGENYEIRVLKGSFYNAFDFIINKSIVSISSPKAGYKVIKNELSKRDELELDALMLSVEEYKEDMAVSEFENFFKKEENKPTDINDLDNDDDE